MKPNAERLKVYIFIAKRCKHTVWNNFMFIAGSVQRSGT